MSETTTFDPRQHVRQLPRGGDYLDVKWRLVWLRSVHPTAQIETEIYSFNEQHAVFRAVIELPTGARATGHGSEEKSDFKDYVEKAETKAIGRALVALGYGTAEAMGDDDAEAGGITNSPVDRPPRQQQAPRLSAVQSQAPGELVFDWSTFWKEARGLGFKDKAAVEHAIGRAIDGLSPAQLRDLLGKADAPAGETRPAPAAPEPRLTDKQRDALFGFAGKKLGERSEEVIHALIAMDYGVGSVNDLTVRQASALIDEFKLGDDEAIWARFDRALKTPLAGSNSAAPQPVTNQQPEMALGGPVTADEVALIQFRERAEGGVDWLALLDEAGTRDAYLAELAATATTIGQLNTVVSRAKQLERYTVRVIAAERARRPELQARADRLTR